MKNFYQYLAPFAPDYSGAAAVLFDTKALIVLCDPGGCSGNVCGYDEPRFYAEGAAIYSAALRDMDTIFGRDEKLVDKIVSAAACGSFELIALVGTPVVSVIATDLEALCHMVEKRTGIRTISVDTNGMEYYDAGQRKARKALEKHFPGKYPALPTPLDSIPGERDLARMTAELQAAFGEMLPEKRILIVHCKESSDLLRNQLVNAGARSVTTGSWFKGCDLRFDDEEKFIETCMGFDAVVADPIYFRALGDYTGVLVAFPHLAASGDLFMENPQ